MAKLNDVDVDEYLKKSVDIEPMAIEEEFVRLPGDLAYWNERYARAVNDYLKAKVGRERTESRLYLEQREHLTAKASVEAAEGKKGAKAPTVDEIRSAVAGHRDMVEAEDAELLMEVEKVRLYGVLDAIRAKRDMLIQIGSRQRVEMEHDPVIREESRVRRLQREGA
jgi:hypothetical protein